MKVELFQELEDQSYPVLKFEVEIYTLAIVGGCKLYFTQKKKIKVTLLFCHPIILLTSPSSKYKVE